jgi:DNA polymerase-3 subunit delta
MTLKELQRQLASKKIAPAYFFYGEEEYLKDQTIRQVATAWLGAAEISEGLENLTATEVDGDSVIQRAQSLGMFAERRVIVVRDAEAFSVKSRKTILEYLESPAPDLCLVICSVALDKKTAFYKGLAERSVMVTFYQVRGPEAVRWVTEKAEAAGLKLTSGAAQLLVDISGQNLAVLEKELEKFLTYLSGTGRSQMTEEDIRALAGSSFEVESYQLADAVCGRDRPTALALYQKLLAAGEDPIRLLSALFYQLEKHWMVLLMSAQGLPDRQIAWAVKTGESFVPAMRTQARKRDSREYLESLSEIFRAEYRLKSGLGDPRSVVQKTIHQLSSQNPRKH